MTLLKIILDAATSTALAERNLVKYSYNTLVLAFTKVSFAKIPAISSGYIHYVMKSNISHP